MTAPFAEEPLPGVWWLTGTRGSNVFVVAIPSGGVALVDAGFADSSPAILRALESIGRPLEGILLTHRHRDHTGAAAAVASATGAPVIAGAGDCRLHDGRLVLRSGIGRSHPLRLAAAFVRRRPAPVPVALAVEAPQEVLPGIRAIPTPGHTPGSLCFIADHLGATFVGDLVISHGGELTRSLRWANHDDARYLQSIAEFARLAPPAGFPGHGVPLLTGFDTALAALAALPRRPLTPRTALERARRLAAFASGFAARRRPARKVKESESP
jgi:glyoxylase-like metal-dependent hydrolase (beta-lactamase superfamily II)